MGKYNSYSHQGDKIIKKDNTETTYADVFSDGMNGGSSDGLFTEYFELQVGQSKAIYIRALKECEISVQGYMHSSLSESNKFSAIELYMLGFEGDDIKPVIGTTAIDLDQPRSEIVSMDGITPSTVIKRIFSENYTQPVDGVIEAYRGVFLTTDDPATGEVIYLPTASEPILLEDGTVIAQSESSSSSRQFSKLFLNQFQEVLLIFNNVDTPGTNEATADVHLSVKYREVKVFD